MGLSELKVFSTDILRVELCGPTQPHLTMVDLPGIFRAGNKDQSVSDARTVKKMVYEYMKRPRSIILAVVSAKSDFALQDVTELARELDPSGNRTLGLITKPDTLDPGSESEAAYLKLAQNKDVVFRLGWHVLKNRSYETRDTSSTERDEAEESFFASGVWRSMDSSHLGVKSLKPRLSNVLKDQIISQLPSLLQDVAKGISDCKEKLKELGRPRTNLAEQRRYLIRVSKHFTALMNAAVHGNYVESFFESAKTKEGYAKRLRARVQNALTDFEEKMRLNGQHRIIVDGEVKKEKGSTRKISRADYIAEVKIVMKKSRGRELPGTFNPLVIAELFAEQCQPWESITMDSKDDILEAVYRTAKAIVEHVCLDETANTILGHVKAGIENLKIDLDEKVVELLDPHYESRPITVNQDLVEAVQKAQSRRRRISFESTLNKYFGGKDCFNGEPWTINPTALLEALHKRSEIDMQQYSSDLAVDYMEAYYQVALKKFVDDVSVLAIENCLVAKLPCLFDAEIIFDLTDEEIDRLAGESDETATKRKQLNEKLDVLEASMRDLKQLDKHRSNDQETDTDLSNGGSVPVDSQVSAWIFATED